MAMNDDMEQRLAQLTPRGLRPELRGQVLAAVGTELQTARGDSTTAAPTTSPWARRCALAVAASLLVGIAMNIWANEASKRHLARLFGPPPVSKQAMELAKDVERITDAQTGRWVFQRLTAPRESRDGLAEYAEYCTTLKQLIDELQIASKDSYYETPQKDSEMGRDRPGRAGGDRSGCQRLVGVDYRYTA